MKYFLYRILNSFAWQMGKFIFIVLLILLWLFLFGNRVDAATASGPSFETADFSPVYLIDYGSSSSSYTNRLETTYTTNTSDFIYQNTAFSDSQGGWALSVRPNMPIIEGYAYSFRIEIWFKSSSQANSFNGTVYLGDAANYTLDTKVDNVLYFGVESGGITSGICSTDGGTTCMYQGYFVYYYYVSFVANDTAETFLITQGTTNMSYAQGDIVIMPSGGVYNMGQYSTLSNTTITNNINSLLQDTETTITNKIEENNQAIQELKEQQQTTNEKLDNLNETQKETNEKLDDIYNNEEENEDGTCKGVICNLKKIVRGIIEFPKTIFNAIVDGIKHLFVPEDMDFINDFMNSISNKLGFIADIPVRIIQFGLDLANASWEEVNSVSLPSIEIFGYNFWNSQIIDLSEGIAIFEPFRYVTDVLCVSIMANGLFKYYENFTGGNEK